MQRSQRKWEDLQVVLDVQALYSVKYLIASENCEQLFLQLLYFGQVLFHWNSSSSLSSSASLRHSDIKYKSFLKETGCRVFRPSSRCSIYPP